MGVGDDIADSVLLAVASVPRGQVISYGQIAAIVGRGGPRTVARILATQGGDVCWWRVIRADGTIAPHLVSEASRRLRAEGVIVRDGRVLGGVDRSI